MKVLSFILSAYLLFLIAVPCCAIDNCSDQFISDGQVANHEEEENNKNDCGNCSPFFTCTACAGFILSVENTVIKTTPSFSNNHYTRYILSPVTDVHFDFWQPPRFS
jgi:hypothetical protein